MLAETLRNSLAVNKRRHDISHAAGTNQAACHSFLTFAKTAQRCRSPLTRGCPCTRISLRLCLHTSFKQHAPESSPISQIAMAPLSLRAFLGFFAPSFIFVFGIKHSLLCCSVIAASQGFRILKRKVSRNRCFVL